MTEITTFELIVVGRDTISCDDICRKYWDHITKTTPGKYSGIAHKVTPDNIHRRYKKELTAPGAGIVLTECFDGRVMVGNPFDFIEPLFLPCRIDIPFFKGSAEKFVKTFFKDYSRQETPQGRVVMGHEFSMAQKHFIKQIGCEYLLEA